MKYVYLTSIFIFILNVLSAADYSFKSTYNSTNRTHTEYVLKGSSCKFQVDNTNRKYYADWKVTDANNNVIYSKNQDEATLKYDPQIEITIDSYRKVQAEIRHDGDYAYKETHTWYIYVAQPDLEVVSYTLNKYEFKAGEKVTFNCTVKNTGKGDAGSSRVGYYLSKNSTWDSGDDRLGYDGVGSLSAGGTSDKGASKNLPSDLIDGTYYILFVADYRNDVSNEKSETNNVEYKKITVTTPKPDFKITFCSVKPSAVDIVNGSPESKVDWSCTVKNDGETRAKIVKLGVYMSSSSSSLGTLVDKKDIADNLVQGLNNNDSDSDNGRFSIPDGLIPATPGNYTRYVHFVADYEDKEDEESETNNTEVRTISLNVIVQKPDFKITSCSVKPSAVDIVNGSPESKVDWSCTVKNDGETRAKIVKLGVYMSSSSSSLGTLVDKKDIADNLVQGLNNNDSDSDNGRFSIPDGLIPATPGNYTRYVHFVADYEDKEDEESETNNTEVRTISLNVIVQKPDFKITSCSVKPSAVDIVNGSPESKVDWSCTVKNDGETRAKIVKLGVYMSSSSSSLGTLVDEKDIADNLVQGLNNNDSDSDNGRFSIPDGLIPATPGNYTRYVHFVADYEDKEDEESETNNTEVRTISLNVIVQKPDFKITSCSVKPSAVDIVNGSPESKVDWSCTVKNDGETRAKIVKLGVYMSSSSSSLGTLVDKKDIADNLVQGLNNNDSDSDNGRFSIPDGLIPATPGNYTRYVHFVADYEDKEDEESETNNTEVRTISLNVIVQKPDFKITSCSVKPSAVDIVNGSPESKVDWSCTVKNDGETRAKIVKLGVYMSSSSSSLGTLVDKKDIADNLAQGLNNNDSDSDSGRFSIPDGLIPATPGNYTRYVHFVADYEDKEDEESETNNTEVRTISLNVITLKPDLNIVYYELKSGKREFIPKEKNIKWTCNVQNIGQEDAPKSTLYLYWSKNPDSYDPVNYLSKDEIKDPSLFGTGGPDSGEIAKCSGKFDLLASLTKGIYYIHFVADPEKVVDDNDRDNNHISCQIEIVAETKPDLVINTSSISKDKVLPGERIVISCQVKNIAQKTAGKTKVGYYLSKDGTINEKNKLGFDNISPLPGGSTSSTNEIEYSIPDDLSPGQWYVIIKADDDNRVSEDKEGNNSSVISIEILSLPDLAISDFQVTNQDISVGGNIYISCQITNLGNTNSVQTELVCYLSEDQKINSSDFELGRIDIPSIDAEGTIQTVKSFKSPSNITSNNWYLIGKLNSQTTQNEITLDNNTKIVDVIFSGSGLKQTQPLINETIYAGSKVYFYTHIKSELPQNQEFVFSIQKNNIDIPCGGKCLGNNLLQCWMDLNGIASGRNITIELPSQVTIDNKSYSLNTDLLPYRATISQIPIEQSISVFAGGSAGASLSLGSVPAVDIALAKVSVSGNAGMQLSFTQNNNGDEFISRSFDAGFGADVKFPAIDVLKHKVEIGASVGATAMATIGQTMIFDDGLSDDFVKKVKAAYILETFSIGGIEINPFVATLKKALIQSISDDTGKTYNDLKYSSFYGTGIETSSNVGFTLKQPKISLLDVGGKRALHNKFTNYNNGSKSYEIKYASGFNLSTLKLENEMGHLLSYKNGSIIKIKANFLPSTGFSSLNFSFEAAQTGQLSLTGLTKTHNYEFNIPGNIISNSLTANELTKSIASIFQYGKEIEPIKIGTNYFDESLNELFTYNPTDLNSNHITFEKAINSSLFVEKSINIDLPKLDIMPGTGLGLNVGFFFRYSDEMDYIESKYIFVDNKQLPIFDQVKVSDSQRLFDFGDQIKDIMEGALLLIKDQFNALIEKTEDIIRAGKEFLVETTNKTCKAFGILSTEGKIILRALDPTTQTVLKSATFTEPKAITAYSSRRVVHPALKSTGINDDDLKSVLYVVSDNYNISLVNNSDEVVQTFDPVNLSIAIDPKKMLELEFDDNFKSLAKIYYYDAENLQWILQEGDKNPDIDTVSVEISKSGSYAVGIEINPALDKTAPDIFDYNPENGDSIQSDTKFWAKIYESQYGSGIDFSKTKLLIDNIEMDAVWDPVNSILSYEPDNTYSKGTHKFTVIAVDNNNNTSEINALVFINDINTGNTDMEITPVSFDCYPNPVSTNLTISVSLNNTKNTMVDIYNLNGQKIKQLFKGELSVGKYEFTWDKTDSYGSLMRPGLYFVRLKIDGEILVKKIIVR